MSKARARERAKARKGKKRTLKVVESTQKFGTSGFNLDSSAIKGPQGNNGKSSSSIKRGSARSG
jgi:hypothetical protein